MTEINAPPQKEDFLSDRSFFSALYALIWWSFFRPTRLIKAMQSLHPDLNAQTGFIQQLWFARSDPKVRRFLGLQLTAWIIISLMSSFLFIIVRIIAASMFIPNMAELLFDITFALIATLMVSLSLCVVSGVAGSLTGSLVSGLVVALALGLSFGLTEGRTTGPALGVSAGLVLGSVGPVFDRLRRQTMGLSSLTDWQRAMGGITFSIISTVAFAVFLSAAVGIANITSAGTISRIVFGLIFGLVGSLGLMAASVLEMRLETGAIHWPRRWVVFDSLMLGLIGGLAGGFTFGVNNNLIIGVAIAVFWGILVGGGGGIAMQSGNGLAAALATTGLAWLFVPNPTNLLDQNTQLVLGSTLLIGLFSYVRLPICLIEVPLTRWQYIQAMRNPQQAIHHLRRTAVYWDELIFYPLPALDQFLVLALQQDREVGLREVAFIAQSFRQSWAANKARLILTVTTLADCTTPEKIAAAPEALDWLADEVMIRLGEGTSEIVPRLLGIAGGVKVTLQADNPYSQRLGYREALDGLDMLKQRLSSLEESSRSRWQPVLNQWQQILLNELEKVSTTTHIAKIENPYQPGNPLQLARKALFKGRRELRDAVVNALLERHRPTLVLHGPRRMGKTSFLLQLPALLPGTTMPIFLDLQRPAATQTTAAFLYSIARAISRDARPYRLQVTPPQRTSFEHSPFEAFAVWLEDIALPSLQDFNLLLTFDEFEKLGEAVTTGRIDAQIFDELRYLIQHQEQLALLFAGVQTLDELGPAWSSYFINIKPLTIDYLSSDEAEELIRRPETESNIDLVYEDEIVHQIIHQTHRHPYLLQLVCSAIVEESNLQKQLQVTPTLFEAALDRALNQGEPYFRNIWDEMAGSEGQPLLRQVAQSPQSLPTSPALTRLLRRHVLSQKEAIYQVEIPLVRRWIVERAP